MIVSLIAAVAENGVIGRSNAIPWHLPADLERFKARTTGHHIIMGRKTFESIGRPLPKRTSIVLSRNADYRPAGVLVAPTLDAALELASDDDEVFVIGGAEVYRPALPRADRLYLTIVHAAIEGDARFPEIDLDEWRLVEDERHEADDRHAYAYSFKSYEKSKRQNVETSKRQNG